tara:strand:+ start:3876 stop:4070 length:195 start_codon:yes stop_codon:yes gene_type:complete
MNELKLEKEELYLLYKELYIIQNKLSYINLSQNKEEKHYKNMIDDIIIKIACIMEKNVINIHLS